MNDSSAHLERSGGTSGRRPTESSTGNGERLLTAAELGEYLGLAAGTVLDRFERGSIPGYRLFGRKGGPVRFRVDEIEAALAEWRVEARS